MNGPSHAACSTRAVRPGECAYVHAKIAGVGCVGAASPHAIKSGM
jgi:hypothetical protein